MRHRLPVKPPASSAIMMVQQEHHTPHEPSLPHQTPDLRVPQGGTPEHVWRRRLMVFGLALLIRGLHVWGCVGNPFFDSPVVDAQTYDEQAQAIAAGTWTDGEAFWQPPLYPYLLACVYMLFGRDLLLVRLLQALLGALTCVMASELTARLAGSRPEGARAAWATGLLLAAYAPLVFFDGELLVPVLSLALDTGALLCLLSSRPRLALGGLLLGLSAIARPTSLLFAGFQGLWLLREPLPFRLRLKRVVRFGALLALPILPVTLHNTQVAHEPVLISSNGGINFYLGNHPDYAQMVGIRPGIAWKDLMRKPAEAGIVGDAATSTWWTQQALEFWQTQPLDMLTLTVQKVWLLFQRDELYRNLDLRFFSRHHAPWLSYGIGYGLLLPLALWGLWRCRGAPDAKLLQRFLLAQAVGVVLFFVVARFRLSLIPVLSVFAGVALGHGLNLLLTQQGRALALHLLGLLGLMGIFSWDPHKLAAIDEAEGFNLVGQAHSNAGRREAALEAFRQALQLQPQHIDATFNLGRELHLLGRCGEALPLYAQALEVYPTDLDALNNHALCMLALGRSAEGVAGLEQVAKRYPGRVDVLFNLGQALAEQAGKAWGAPRETGWQAAFARLHEAQQLKPGDPTLQETEQVWQQAQLRQVQQEKRVESLLRQASAPTMPPVETPKSAPQAQQLNNEGHRRLVARDIPAALEHFISALEISPGWEVAWSNLGQALLLQGTAEPARQAFEQALKLRPTYEVAQLGRLFVLLELLKNPPAGQDSVALRAQLEQELTPLLTSEQPGLRTRAQGLAQTLQGLKPAGAAR